MRKPEEWYVSGPTELFAMEGAVAYNKQSKSIRKIDEETFMDTKEYKDRVEITGVKDFVLSQTMECGQCFNFRKTDEEEYDIMAFKRPVHVKQEEDKVILYNTDIDTYEKVWKNYFDMDRDYSEIKRCVCLADDKLVCAVEQKPGIRILNQDFFETLISFIISQNKQITQIKQIVKNISHNFGEPVIGYNGETFYTFPDPEVLNEVSEEALRECKMGFRAPYIKNACKAYTDGCLDEVILRTAPIDEARQVLMQIKGVGEKVANCVLLFGLGRREAFPVDVWMKRICEQMYFEGKDTKKSVIEEFAVKRFGEYGGYAQQYLFDYARNNLNL